MHPVLRTVRLLGRALALGLGLLGALVVLVTFRLAVGWGLLSVAGALLAGSTCLVLAARVQHRRVHRTARTGILELETMLRRSRGRAGGAE